MHTQRLKVNTIKLYIAIHAHTNKKSIRIQSQHAHTSNKKYDVLIWVHYKNLERFRKGTDTILVATDVAARGLDVELVQHVVHYHLPLTAELYGNMHTRVFVCFYMRCAATDAATELVQYVVHYHLLLTAELYGKHTRDGPTCAVLIALPMLLCFLCQLFTFKYLLPAQTLTPLYSMCSPSKRPHGARLRRGHLASAGVARRIQQVRVDMQISRKRRYNNKKNTLFKWWFITL